MRGAELTGELERLAAAAAAARAQLVDLREQLSQARAMIEDVRRILGDGEDRSLEAPDGTPGATGAQGEARPE
jgi:hypothetical protein